VVANRGLGQVERGGQVTDADLAALVRPDQRDQPEPDRIAERLEYLRQLCRAGLAQRLSGEREADALAGCRLRPGSARAVATALDRPDALTDRTKN